MKGWGKVETHWSHVGRHHLAALMAKGKQRLSEKGSTHTFVTNTVSSNHRMCLFGSGDQLLEVSLARFLLRCVMVVYEVGTP